MLSKAVQDQSIQGFLVGRVNEPLMISHFLFADDTFFVDLILNRLAI